MYGKSKINEMMTDDTMIKYRQDGKNKEMKAGSAKMQPADHPAKIAYERQWDSEGNVGDVNISWDDKPGKGKPDSDQSKDAKKYDPNAVHKKGEAVPTSDLVGKFKADNPDGFEDDYDKLKSAALFAIENYKAATGNDFTSDDLDGETPREILDFIESATGNDDIDWEDLNDVLNQAYEWNINFDGENNDKSDWNFKFESVDFRKIKQQWLNENL